MIFFIKEPVAQSEQFVPGPVLGQVTQLSSQFSHSQVSERN